MTVLDKPWLKSYKLGPYKLDASLAPYPELPLYHLLDQAAASYPNQTAVLFEGRELKYYQLKSQVDRLAGALTRLGVHKGDQVCLFLPNCLEYVLCYWAVLKAGGVVVPTSILRSPEGLAYELRESGARLLVCREEHLEMVQAAREQCAVECILVTSSAGYDLQALSAPLPPGALELRSTLAESDAQPPEVEIDPKHDLCELAFTGGATGIPKGVMLSHYNRYCAVLQGLPWMMKLMLRSLAGRASVLLSIPLFHTYGGFIQQSAAYLGMRLILLPDPRDAQAMADNIIQHRPFLVPGVPTQFMRLAEMGLRRSNTMLFSGAAPLPQEVAQHIKDKTGMSVSEGYGLTETSAMVTLNVSAFSRITGFIGQEIPGIGVPVPDTEVRLVDPASGLDTDAEQGGELLVRGPQLMLGYWPEPGSGLTSDGWLYTGDIAVMDEAGYFRIVDRIKDMVNVSGLKVYTTQVDEVLFRHPAVLMAAAFGVPDPEIPGSERVMAVVRLKDEPRETVSVAELQAYCREHLPPYAVPKYIEFRDDLPLTVTEKLFKRVLREEAIHRMQDKSD